MYTFKYKSVCIYICANKSRPGDLSIRRNSVGVYSLCVCETSKARLRCRDSVCCNRITNTNHNRYQIFGHGIYIIIHHTRVLSYTGRYEILCRTPSQGYTRGMRARRVNSGIYDFPVVKNKNKHHNDLMR